MKRESYTKQNKALRGFTLVEMLVSVGLFAIIMTISVGTLIILIDASNNAQAMQNITSNLSFALDKMSRTIRTGYSYYCTSSPNVSLQDGANDCVSGATALIFTDSRTGYRTAYRFNSASSTIEERVADRFGDGGSWLPLTSNDVLIEDIRFYVTGSVSLSNGDGRQPTMRMLLRGRASDALVEAPIFYMQSSVVSRSIDY